MSVLMNVVSICRSRSGLAWASCSCRKRWGRHCWVRSSRRTPEGLWKVSRRSRGGRLYVGPHPGWGPSYTTLADATHLTSRRLIARVWTEQEAVNMSSYPGDFSIPVDEGGPG